jgi:hypothetical protein
MYASVNTNTVINLSHSNAQALALHVQEKPPYLEI